MNIMASGGALWNSVTGLAQRLAGWLPWFRPLNSPPHLPAPPPLPIDLSPLEVVAPKPKRARRTREPLHVSDVLDLLPKCRELMSPLRRLDLPSYRFWQVFGAKITVADSIDWKVPRWPKDLPAHGMIFHYDAAWEAEDRFPGHFVYFTKLKRNPHDAVVPPGTVVMFVITVAFTENKNKGIAYEYFAALNGDGEITIVSQRNQERQSLRRGGAFWKTRWGYSAWLEFHFKEHKRICPKDRQCESVAAFGERLFRDAMWQYCAGFDDFQVRAERDGISVAFNVAVGRTPAFFKDRETDAARDGKRKRIFHAVAQHARVSADGTETNIRAHYRGERSFMWKGERIVITPADRSLAKTFTDPAERADIGTKIPDGSYDAADIAPYLRELEELDWRPGHKRSIGEPPWRVRSKADDGAERRQRQRLKGGRRF